MITPYMFGLEEKDPMLLGQIAKTIQHESVARAVFCADRHVGYGVPIGAAIGYRGHISPTAVGYDIGCGNKAVRLDIPAKEVRTHIHQIMKDISSNLSFGMGRNNNQVVDHPLFENSVFWEMKPLNKFKQLARNQLGTIGGGNHYVDIFVDENEHVWVGVHFGSRGFGHKTATYFLKEAGASDALDAEPTVFSMNSNIGQDYYMAMQLAGSYAYAGRDWVCDEVARMLGATIFQSVHNHHNFAWLEYHDGEELMVVRKGSTPSFPGQMSFVGGSMGDNAYILMGMESLKSRDALYSTVHGAGRVMSRKQAKGKPDRVNKGTGAPIPGKPGAISKADMTEWLRVKGVVLEGGDLDEAPQAYKRLDEVLAYHTNTIQVMHRLVPIGVCMAKPGERDDYKD